MSDCEKCPLHAAVVRLHREALSVAGRAVKRGDRPVKATRDRDELRAAIREFEATALRELGLEFGWPQEEQGR